LHARCLDAAEAVIAHGWWDRLGLPPAARPAILRSWERDDFSLYGRFDLAFDGRGAPKLLEYNADTPTALVEAAVAQWYWLQETRPGADQFNSLHERLVAAWRRWAATLPAAPDGSAPAVHFCAVRDHAEDEQTVLYLRDTATQAGLATHGLTVDELGWAPHAGVFVDADFRPVEHCFKLYPWEWLWAEEFAPHLAGDPVHFFEPAWKMLLSNKALLPILWELFPGHPNLLPAYDRPEPLGTRFVRKPRLGREGANVARIEGGVAVEETGGAYGDEGWIYQAIADLPDHDGHHAVCGVWIVDHEPAGLGLREDTRRITGNLSRFVPHYFR
jgi:glutathionylspermidine synthase